SGGIGPAQPLSLRGCSWCARVADDRVCLVARSAAPPLPLPAVSRPSALRQRPEGRAPEPVRCSPTPPLPAPRRRRESPPRPPLLFGTERSPPPPSVSRHPDRHGDAPAAVPT